MFLTLISYFFIIWQAATQNYLVSLNNPFLLSNNNASINTIDPDLQNNFYVGFADGQARRYTTTFSSYINLTVPEPVNQFSGWSLTLNNLRLNNGTIFTMNSNYMLTISNVFSTVRIYDYSTFIQIDSYSITDKILDQRGFPIQVSGNIYPFQMLMC